MDQTRHQLGPGILLDARRAIWLEEPRVLAVADLHLGYAWAQRQRGLMLPLGAEEETIDRLLALQKDYDPREIVLLGDIVHRAVALPALKAQLDDLVRRVALHHLILVRGNHDRHLDTLLANYDLPLQLVSEFTAGGHWLVHGDDEALSKSLSEKASGRRRVGFGVPPLGGSGAMPPEGGTPNSDSRTRSKGRERPVNQRTAKGRMIMGHEHPAIVIGNGVESWAKCPCFLVSEQLIVLPAFSPWASGTVIGSHPFMSQAAQRAQFRQALAIVGNKLLPVPLKSGHVATHRRAGL